ncbi:MAG: flagellar motor protein MotA, partial [Alphaproteobacteria bacterium]
HLIRMVLFLGLVVALVIAFHEPLHQAFMANPAINGVILAVFAIGVVYVFRQVGMLSNEIAWMEMFRRRRPGISVQMQPRLLATVAAAFSEREGPVRLSAMSTRALLDGVSARLDESGQIARYLIGLLIFLGLLGTFWGLIQTIGAVSDVIGGLRAGGAGGQAGVFEELKVGLRGPLAGMGTAFSSSLFGLAGALVLGFLDLQVSQAQNRFFQELEEWMSTITRHGSGATGFDADQSVPAYIQALLEQTAESLEGLQKTVGRAEEGRLTANRSMQALVERLTHLTDQMRAEQQLLVRIAEQQIEMQPVIRRLAESASHAGMDEATRDHIRNIDLYLARLIEDINVGRSETVQDVRNEIKLLARTIAAVREDERR